MYGHRFVCSRFLHFYTGTANLCKDYFWLQNRKYFDEPTRYNNNWFLNYGRARLGFSKMPNGPGGHAFN
jgi:hypothetical protein